ncbi:hypothetical protein ACHQM5_009189 [Ranunculus cassubicifolius]
MSCLQITAFGPHAKTRHISPPRSTYLRAPTRQASNVVCVFGGERKAGNGDEAPSPWKSLEQAMQGFKKERSVQDVLREQMQKGDFSNEFGGGGLPRPPSGGGGGGGRGGGGSSGGPADDGMAGVIDETVQVVLATLGFVFLYMYILQGEEIARLGKDYVKYIFTKKESVRLRRSLDKWSAFYDHLTRKEEVVEEDWLEREILNTPTWWHDPYKVKREMGYRLRSGYYDEKR